ncbi:XPG domain containing-domain-containing protein [Leptodontidium sp. MPI-SDFR-AT-0119]|nr:XPG domain containing-domain-containing protein [Leptodontidium sp. MPI-SDFR-AT-0119]
MGIRHLTTFLRPYAAAESLDGKQVVIDGPSFAHQIYYICLRASPGARNALEAAPSYQILVDTAIAWLDTIRESNVEIKKIYFDGFLPPAKLDVRLQRLQNSTHQLTQFHQSNNEPCRSSFPQTNSTPVSLFQNTAVRSGLTALPALSFVVPAILEALKASSIYADITEVVPGEADLYCARYLEKHGGVVFTSDSDLLVHDLGHDGAVSFFHDIESSENDASGILRAQIFQPAVISDRLALPNSHGLHSLAFEISMDNHGTFPKLLTRAQSLKAVKENLQMFEDFLKEYAPLPIQSDLPTDVETLRVLRRLHPRTSEYVLHFPSLARIASQPLVSGKSASLSPHIFLPFLLDCPVRTNAWEVSTATRQLAYGLVNVMVPATEQVSSVFEHRRQTDNSDGRELMLPEVPDISGACIAIVETYKELKKKLPEFTEKQLWMAFAVHQDMEWSAMNSKTPISQLLLQRLAYPKISDPSGYFGWDIVQFFAQLQGSLYSLRILQQITSLVVSIEPKTLIPEAVRDLNSLLSSVPRLVDYPDLGTASSIIRKSEEGLRFMKGLKDILKILDSSSSSTASGPSKSRKSSRKKRKRDQAGSELPVGKAKSSNPFSLLESG